MREGGRNTKKVKTQSLVGSDDTVTFAKFMLERTYKREIQNKLNCFATNSCDNHGRESSAENEKNIMFNHSTDNNDKKGATTNVLQYSLQSHDIRTEVKEKEGREE